MMFKGFLFNYFSVDQYAYTKDHSFTHNRRNLQLCAEYDSLHCDSHGHSTQLCRRQRHKANLNRHSVTTDVKKSSDFHECSRHAYSYIWCLLI